MASQITGSTRQLNAGAVLRRARLVLPARLYAGAEVLVRRRTRQAQLALLGSEDTLATAGRTGLPIKALAANYKRFGWGLDRLESKAFGLILGLELISPEHLHRL